MTKIINYFLFIIALHVVFVCHGAVLLVKDKNGMSVLDLASSKQDYETVKFLKKQATVN